MAWNATDGAALKLWHPGLGVALDAGGPRNLNHKIHDSGPSLQVHRDKNGSSKSEKQELPDGPGLRENKQPSEADSAADEVQSVSRLSRENLYQQAIVKAIADAIISDGLARIHDKDWETCRRGGHYHGNSEEDLRYT